MRFFRRRRSVGSFDEIPWMATFVDRHGIEWRKNRVNGAYTNGSYLPDGYNVFASGPYLITDDAARFNKL